MGDLIILIAIRYRAVITKSLKDAQKIEEKEEKVSKELTLLAEKKAELQLAISQAEETRNAHTYVSELDVIHAKGILSDNQKLSKNIY